MEEALGIIFKPWIEWIEKLIKDARARRRAKRIRDELQNRS